MYLKPHMSTRAATEPRGCISFCFVSNVEPWLTLLAAVQGLVIPENGGGDMDAMDADGLAAAVTKQGSLVRQMKKVCVCVFFSLLVLVVVVMFTRRGQAGYN